MADATLSDRLVVEIGANLAPLSQSLATASRDVNAFASGTVANAARGMNDAFDATFRGLERAVYKAARTGQFSMRDMVNSILADLARITIHRSIVVPLENLARDVLGSIFGTIGGRATGGPVGPGSAYVVGERGPELFVPAGNGTVVPQGSTMPARPQIVVNIQTPNAQSFLKSEGQVAAMVTRALARGQRNL